MSRRKRREKRRQSRMAPPAASPQIPDTTPAHAELLGVGGPAPDFEDLVLRLRFGNVLSEQEARALIRHGFALAAKATTSREFDTAMRPLMKLMKFQRELEGHQPAPKHVHNHLHIETPDEKHARLSAIASELGIS